MQRERSAFESGHSEDNCDMAESESDQRSHFGQCQPSTALKAFVTDLLDQNEVSARDHKSQVVGEKMQEYVMAFQSDACKCGKCSLEHLGYNYVKIHAGKRQKKEATSSMTTI